MKIQELLKKNNEELHELLRESRNTLRNFRFQVGQGKVKNNKQGRMLKKTIARVLMLLHTKKYE